MSNDHLHNPAHFPPTASGRSISHFMHMIWQMRPDLQQVFDLEEERGRERFIAWYAEAAPREFRMPALIPVHGKGAASPSELVYGMKAFAQRASSFGQWVPLPVRRRMMRYWLRAGVALSARGIGRVKPAESAGDEPLRGVNLVGYANGMLSLGEHLRMTRSAFETTDCGFDVIDYRNGATNRQLAAADRIELADRNRYAVNLFHINADQMLNAYCHFGPGFFGGRYNIGFWAWELERFPDGWAPVASLLDEVWAPSRFVQEAVQTVTDKPVTLMPQCVELPPFERRSRASFGLPDEDYLFIFTFDFLSYFDRKNPMAAIRAFRQAFPDPAEKAGLVIKVMNGDEADPRWKAMLAEIGGDARIAVINEGMSRGDSLALMDCCDCFLSLHRSEGFGRGPAEAMLLGKPVIVTGYSGNLEFTKPDNSYLVDYVLVPVQPGQYVFGEGQVWADPSVDHAAQLMRRVFDDPAEAGRVARSGQDHVREALSARTIGALMRERLATLDMV